MQDPIEETQKEAENLPKKIKKDVIVPKRGNTNSDCPLRYEYEENGSDKLKCVHMSDKLDGLEAFKEIFGSNDNELIHEMTRLSTNTMRGMSEEVKQNAILQAMYDGKPSNSMEGKLIAQAHTLFSQGMRLMSFANDENMIPQQAHCMKYALKCLRLRFDMAFVNSDRWGNNYNDCPQVRPGHSIDFHKAATFPWKDFLEANAVILAGKRDVEMCWSVIVLCASAA